MKHYGMIRVLQTYIQYILLQVFFYTIQKRGFICRIDELNNGKRNFVMTILLICFINLYIPI